MLIKTLCSSYAYYRPQQCVCGKVIFFTRICHSVGYVSWGRYQGVGILGYVTQWVGIRGGGRYLGGRYPGGLVSRGLGIPVMDRYILPPHY